MIKRKLYDHNFRDYLQTDIPDHSDITVCKYYSVEKYVENFNETRHSTSSGLKLLHINIRSLDKHFNELISMINTLNDVDIIALSEIGKKNIKNREAQLMKMGYHFHYKEPTLARGGVGIIFNKRCKCLNVRDDLQFEGKDVNDCKLETENIWIETEYENECITIGLVYRHPGGTVNGLKHFTEHMENNMNKTNSEGKKCIITGDLNLDGLKMSQNEHVKEFFDTSIENNFQPIQPELQKPVQH